MREPVPQLDIRLRRELAHRRLAFSILRRILRVLSLHLLDVGVVVGVVLLLERVAPLGRDPRPYIPVLTAIVLLSLNALCAYDPGDARRDTHRIFSGVGLSLLIIGCLIYFPPALPLGFEWLALFGASATVGLVAGRKATDRFVRQVYARGIGLRRAVIIGNLDEVGRTLRLVREDEKHVDQFVVGHVTPGEGHDPTALGTLSDLVGIIDQNGVQEVIVAAALAPEQIRPIVEASFERGAAVYVVPALGRASEFRAEPARLGSCAVLRLHPGRLKFPGLVLKRAFDLVVATLMLVLVAPLMVLIAVAIRLDSPGPALYRARRIGLGGRDFQMWKFRSMYQDAEAREKELAHLNIYEGGTFKIPNDPRITRVGRLLRRTSLDELPQLFNVLTGEMSLVGPRPALLGDIARYEPHHFERLSVIPGITGPWQVGGRNLITNFETIVEMEQAYIRSWSPLLDVKILLRTLKVVWTGEGAY